MPTDRELAQHLLADTHDAGMSAIIHALLHIGDELAALRRLAEPARIVDRTRAPASGEADPPTDAAQCPSRTTLVTLPGAPTLRCRLHDRHDGAHAQIPPGWTEPFFWSDRSDEPQETPIA